MADDHGGAVQAAEQQRGHHPGSGQSVVGLDEVDIQDMLGDRVPLGEVEETLP